MNTLFHKLWTQLRQDGLFELFLQSDVNWKTIINKVIRLTNHDNYHVMLSALFQISGVSIPLQLAHDPKTLFQSSKVEQIQTGHVFAAHCMSEQSVGTDIFSMQTTANQVGENWIINGTKTYICNAPIAQVGLLYARIEGDKYKAPYNLGCFLLDFSLPGIDVIPLKKIGLDGIPMGKIHIDNVILPSTHQIGQYTMGHNIVYMSTTFERLLIPLAFVGIMEKLYLQAPKAMKAEIYRRFIASKCLLESTLAQIDRQRWDRNYIQLGCLLKWQLSEAYIETAKMSHNETLYRDALSSWIYSGTNDTLKATLEQLL